MLPALLFLEAVAKEEPVRLGRRVVVIGGGNAAIDSARTALRMGAEVTVIYRRERKDMPAIREETEAAEDEGAKFVFLATPHRIVGDENGNVKAIEVVKTRLGEFDSSGRRRPIPTDEIRRFECDTVILAVGEAVDMDFVRASGLRIKENGTLEVDRYTLETSRSKFYAGGDLITGASNVSNAMGYGKKAARTIDCRLMGGGRWDAINPQFAYANGRRTSRSRPGGTRSASCPRPNASRASWRPWSGFPAEEALEEVRALPALRHQGTPLKENIACLTNSRFESTANTSPRTQGQTILEVARANGKYIPTLCWLESLTPVGACRLCIVEVSGVNRLLPACTTPVQDGMSVTTNSEKLKQLPAHRPGVPLLGAQSPVRRVRLQQPLRAAGHGAAPGRDQRALPLRVSQAAGGRFPRALRARPQPLHPVHALRAGVRGGGGRARLGRQPARHHEHHRVRHGQAVGRVQELHQLRQVRAGVPHRRAGRKGIRRRGDGEARRIR